VGKALYIKGNENSVKKGVVRSAFDRYQLSPKKLHATNSGYNYLYTQVLPMKKIVKKIYCKRLFPKHIIYIPKRLFKNEPAA